VSNKEKYIKDLSTLFNGILENLIDNSNKENIKKAEKVDISEIKYYRISDIKETFKKLLYFYQRLENCDICPNNCKVDRFEGQKGKCNQTANLKIASYNLHFGEEPFISGNNGSGTIFFSGCALKCVFCQNYPISQLNNGNIYSIQKLVDIIINLYNKKTHNINLVTPTHFAPQILFAILFSKIKGINIPFVYNNSGYEKKEVLEIIKDFIDIYLYDIKYGDNELAFKLSGVENYVETNIEGLKYLVEIYSDNLFYGFDEIVRRVCNGECLSCSNPVHEIKDNKVKVAKRGIILRHLIIPGKLKNSFKILDIVSDISKNITIGLMNQYFPAYKSYEYKKYKIDRKLKMEEYDKVINYAIKRGFSNILVQI
jgi:putative pyruvate formate lyase activating enzyme